MHSLRGLHPGRVIREDPSPGGGPTQCGHFMVGLEQSGAEDQQGARSGQEEGGHGDR